MNALSVLTLITYTLPSCSASWWQSNSQNTDNDYSIPDLINELRSDLRYEFDRSGSSKPLLAKAVRLSFHDCVGPSEEGDTAYGQKAICNGCVNLDNEHNNGLAAAIQPLEFIYHDLYQHEMSRADFYAAAGTIAIEYAQELDDKYDDKLPSIPFYFGRTDCDSSPYGSVHKEFSNAHQGWDETFAFLKDNFGMNEQEVIALLGAHTLGKARKYNLGYGTKPWVDISYVLNNAYYNTMVFEDWKQNEVNCDSEFGCRREWHDNSDYYLMFNSDMCIMWDIKPDKDGIVKDCDDDIQSCPDQISDIQDITIRYAEDNQVWLNDFVEAWKIMITNGYDVKKDLKEYDGGYYGIEY